MSYDPVASLQVHLVELVAWLTSLALLRLMKRYSGDVLSIHGNPVERAPFTKRNHFKMEGKGSNARTTLEYVGEVSEFKL